MAGLHLLYNIKLLTLPEVLGSSLVFSGVRVTRSLVLCVCFVDRYLSFFFWPLCCLFFLDLWNLNTSLVYSNSSYRIVGTILKSNIKFVERGKTDTHDCSLSWLSTGASIKNKWRGYISVTIIKLIIQI